MIATALAEKISALATDDYLRERAARGSRQKFEKTLQQVKDSTLAEENRL